MMWKSRVFVGATAVVLMSACGAPVLKTKKMDSNMLAYYTGEGGVVVQKDMTAEAAVMCVAPPAQAGRQVSGKGEAKADAAVTEVVDVGAGGGGERDHDVVKLHDLNTSMVFMQHGLYRLCESRMNGFMEEGEYVDLVTQIIEASKHLAEQEAKIAEQAAKVAVADSEAESAKAEQAASRAEEAKLRAEEAKALLDAKAAELETLRMKAAAPR